MGGLFADCLSTNPSVFRAFPPAHAQDGSILQALVQPVAGAEPLALGPPPASIPSSSQTSATLSLPCVLWTWQGR